MNLAASEWPLPSVFARTWLRIAFSRLARSMPFPIRKPAELPPTESVLPLHRERLTDRIKHARQPGMYSPASAGSPAPACSPLASLLARIPDPLLPFAPGEIADHRA